MDKLIPWNDNDGNIILRNVTGSGDNEIEILSSENTSFQSRSQVISLYTTDFETPVTKNLNVTQKGFKTPVGTVYDFDYTGTVQEVTLSAGAYKLQVWGGQGGTNPEASEYGITQTRFGAKGGYSEGILILDEPKILYVFVGQGRPSSTSTNGGWNGGGGGAKACTYGDYWDEYGKGVARVGSGGGATDIAVVTSTMTYSSYRTNRSSASLLSRFIVAGGGAGGYYNVKYKGVPFWDNVITISNLTQGDTGTINGATYGVSQGGSASYQYGYVTQLLFTPDQCPFNNGDKIRITWQNGGSDARTSVYWYKQGSSNVYELSNSTNIGPREFTVDASKKPDSTWRYMIQLYQFQERYTGPIVIEKEEVNKLKLTNITTNSTLYPLARPTESQKWGIGGTSWNGYILDVTNYRGHLITVTPNAANETYTGTSQVLFYKTAAATGQDIDFCDGESTWSLLVTIGTVGSMFVPSDAVYMYVLTQAGEKQRTPAEITFQEISRTTVYTAAQDSSNSPRGGGETGWSHSSYSQYRGTQTTAGTNGGFGYGANFQSASSRFHGGLGGGGWYGGGSARGLNTGTVSYGYCCGGGSGFVNIPANASSRPANYTGLELKTGATYGYGDGNHPAVNGGTEDGHEGNGYARITAVDEYKYHYLTFEALKDTIFSFSTNDLQYSVDDGSTWNTLTAGTSTSIITKGSRILWKQTGLTPVQTYGIGTFSADREFKVYGNIMSLLFGDNYVNAVDLTGYDYAFMRLFRNATYLIDSENLILPATTLSNACYNSMFSGCQNMTSTVKILPATELLPTCYREMYRGCSSILYGPKIEATSCSSGAQHCSNMFYACIKLKESPILKCSTLGQRSYEQMFAGCTSLSKITCLASDMSAQSCLSSWVKGISTAGTFIKKDSTTVWTTGISGIPTSYTTVDTYTDPENVFTMELTSDSASGHIYLDIPSEIASLYDYCEYTTNLAANNWTRVSSDSNTDNVLDTGQLSAGQRVYFRGSGTAMAGSINSAWCQCFFHFDEGVKVKLSGSIMALCGTNVVSPNMFAYLFDQTEGDSTSSYGVVSVKDVIFPDTTNESCFEGLFAYNPVIDVPVLPALIMSYACYCDMFWGTLITETPELPATVLAKSCYSYMFEECGNLVTVYDLTAQVEERCYYCMFNYCTSLETMPVLPCTNLKEECYAYMFEGCTSLKTVYDLPATNLSEGCYSRMFKDCTSLIVSPKIYGMVLQVNCYTSMFEGCSNLREVRLYASDISASNCLSRFLADVASHGVIHKTSEVTLPASVVPEGWQLMDDYDYSYFAIESLGDSNSIVCYNNGSNSSDIYISTDNCVTWTQKTCSSGSTSLATINTGDKLYIKAVKTRWTEGTTSSIQSMACSKTYNVSGNIMSLLYGDNFYDRKVLPDTYTFTSFFYNKTLLLSAENLILPATTLTENCYRSMFSGCSNITTVPKLPALFLPTGAYLYMFSSCTLLTKVEAMFLTTPTSSLTSWLPTSSLADGIFIKNNKAKWNVTGPNGVPPYWTIKTLPHKLEPLIPFEVLDGKVAGASNGAIIDRNYGCIYKYNVTAGETYYATAYAPQTTVYYINWMDGQGNRVGADLQGDGTTNKTWEDEPVTAPIGAVEMWMNLRYDNITKYLFSK